jgi:hypothetical protein
MTPDPTTTAKAIAKALDDNRREWFFEQRDYPAEIDWQAIARIVDTALASPAPAAEPSAPPLEQFADPATGQPLFRQAAPPAPAPPDEVERRLAEIEVREKAATKGPWQNYYNRHAVFQSLAPYPQTDRVRDVAQVQTHDDGDFIAHARQDIPWLVAQLRARLASPASPATREGE